MPSFKPVFVTKEGLHDFSHKNGLLRNNATKFCILKLIMFAQTMNICMGPQVVLVEKRKHLSIHVLLFL